MVRVKRREGPVDYSLCSQTVTIYHWERPDTFSRRVIEKGAFLDFRKNQSISKTGSREVNGFLLVVPCSEIPVAVGDKVLHGEGPEIASMEEWRAFVPSAVSGLVEVKYIDPKYWKGRLVHVEAGG